MDYDSADSAVSDLDDEEEEEDVFDGATTTTNPKGLDKENTEHSNPSSYSWYVMRLAIMKVVQHQLQDFLNVAGIEIQGEQFVSFLLLLFLLLILIYLFVYFFIVVLFCFYSLSLLLLFHQYYWSTVDSYEHLGSVIQEVMKI